MSLKESESDNFATVPQEFAGREVLRSLLDLVEDGAYLVDCERRIVYWNHGAEKITGYLSHQVAGRFCQNDMLMHCDTEGTILCGGGCPLLSVMGDGSPRECTVFLRHRHGYRVPVRIQARAVRNASGQIVGAVEVFRSEAAQSRIEQFTGEKHFGVDEATGAANRDFGEMALAHALAEMSRFEVPVGWVVVELDRVKELEQKFGHGLTDAAMKAVAQTLHANAGTYDLVVRWDRTGFRVLVHRASHARIAELTERFAVIVRASSVAWWGDSMSITASVAGVSANPTDSLEPLEHRAGRLIEQCRKRGGNCASCELEPGESRHGNIFRTL